MTEHTWTGECLCGALQFDATGEPADVCYCHCASCRAASGAPFVVWCTFPTHAFNVRAGQLTTYKSSDKVERGFCAHCGTTVTYFHESRPDEIDLSVTTLHDADRVRPLRHIFVAEQLPWLTIADELPRFDGWGEP